MKTNRLIMAFIAMIIIITTSCNNDNEASPILPDIGITAPADKSVLTSGQDVKISAAATDDNGKIARMDFYVGTEKIGDDPIAPYEMVWPKVQAGDYTLTVNTVDEDGSEMASASITVKVVDATQ